MRILMLCPSSPVPPDTGGRIRMLEAVRALGQTDEITVVALTDSTQQREAFANLRGLGVRIHAIPHRRSRMSAALQGLLTGRPMHVAGYTSRRMKEVASELLREGTFDVVWCHLLYLVENIPDTQVPLVLDQQNLDHALWRRVSDRADNVPMRLFGKLNAWAWGRMQRKHLHRFRAIFAVSQEEQAETASIVQDPGRVWLVPNGVSGAKALSSGDLPAASPRVLFCGAMHIRMNEDAAVWLATVAWPLVRALIADAELWLVGGRPTSRVKGLENIPGVYVTGWVDEVRSHYRAASVAVVPLRLGGGTKLKALEAMDYGVPLVSTSVGVQGLDVVDGDHVLVADTAQSFAEAIVALLTDRKRALGLAENAHARVQALYRWENVFSVLRSKLALMLESGHPASQAERP